MDRTFENFTELVRAMRAAQKAYFRTCTGDALKEAKRLEAEVDRALKPRRGRETGGAAAMSNHGMAIQFALERNYECARQCLLDAFFVANEREYHGIVALVVAALDNLEAIGRLAGIVPQPQICGPVVDEEARNE